MNYRIQSYYAEQLDREIITRLSSYYRYQFINGYLQNFLITPSSLQCLKLREFFTHEAYVDLDVLDSFCDFPLCPDTQTAAIFRYSPSVLSENFVTKMKNQGVLTFLFDEQNEIQGFIQGYYTNLEQAYQWEEWQDPYLYAGLAGESYRRCWQSLVDVITEGKIDLRSEPRKTPVFIYSAIAISEKYRDMSYFYKLSHAFFSTVRQAPAYANTQLILAQAQYNSTAFNMDNAFGMKPLPGFLGDKECLLVGDLHTITDFALSPSSAYWAKLKSYLENLTT